MVNDTVSRKIGNIESFFVGFQKSKMYESFNIAADYSKPILPSVLAQALRATLLNHTLLLCNIIGTSVKVNESTKFSDVVKYVDYDGKSLEDSLNELSQIQLPIGIDNLPLWRIYVMGKDQNQLHIIHNHSLSDGTSGVNFHKVLLSELNSNKHKSVPDFDRSFLLFDFTVDGTHIPEIPPAIENIIEFPPPTGPLKILTGETVWKTDLIAKLGSDHLFKVLKLTAEENISIKEKCKTHNVKTTSFLQTCFFVAHGRIESNFNPDKLKEVGYGVDVRKFERKDKKDHDLLFGANICSGYHSYPSIKDFSWDHVEKASDELTESLESGSIREFTSAGIYGVPPESWEQYQTTNILGQPRGALLIGNLGFQTMSESSSPEYEITDVYFSQSAFTMSFVYCLNSIATKYGMNIVVTMVKDSHEVEKFDELLRIFKSLLLES